MIAKLLARYPLLRLLEPPQIDDWLAEGRGVDCAAGFTILQENTPGAWVYLVREGRVRVLRQSGSRDISFGMLQAGDLFGEYALLHPGLNTATCRTAAPSRLLRLPLAPLRTALQARESVWRNLKNWLRLHILLHFYRERSFLGFMSADSGLKLLDRMKLATFLAGQTIQADGLAADNWYVIEHGMVRLYHGDSEVAGTEDLGPGDAFGEYGLLGADNVATAVALSDVRCQVLARPSFDPRVPATSRGAQSYQPRTPARPEEHVWVPQLGPTDCGLAALAMVGLRFGVTASVEQLREKATPGPQGLSLRQLAALATELGLTSRAVSVSADRLRQVRLPAVALLKGGHYVVLHELGESCVVVGDPEMGIVTWSVDYLGQCYSGSLLLLHPRAG